MCTVKVNGSCVQALIDTGATVNVMDFTQYQLLSPRPPLAPSSPKIYTYGGTVPLPLRGVICTTVASENHTTETKFHITDGKEGTLLSCHTAEDLGLVFFANQVPESHAKELLDEFPGLFHGLGKLKDKKVKLHIDTSVRPVALRHRRVPFNLRPQVEAELRKLEELDVIEKVSGPTPWVSPLVVAPKPKQPGAIRLCVDMRLPNVAVKRERHITPMMDDIVADLNGARWFSKLDLNAGSHQLELEPESRYITTFSTHIGLRRYKRLSFGVSSAAEIFQNTIREALSGLQGVINLSDDILVYSQTLEEHHTHLRATLKRLADCGLTLHKEKCLFYQDNIDFFGYIFTRDGLRVDPRKVEAIRKDSTPQSLTAVRSFLGMATYCGRFIPNLAAISEPLRALTQHDQKWEWTPAAEKAFHDIKAGLLDDTVMAYFRPGRRTELVVDASPVGLGAVLLQEHSPGEWRPVAYASKALTDTETRYAQIEREALEVKWACTHFHLYLCGQEFQVITDHKPLIPLFAGSSRLAPPRIERWAVQLQAYKFTLVFRPGAHNPADYLSRHPERRTEAGQTNDAQDTELFVNLVSNGSCPKTMTLEDIGRASREDPVLSRVKEALSNNGWARFLEGAHAIRPEVAHARQELWKIRNELSVGAEGVVLRGHLIVIPDALQKHTLDLAHIGHQGMAKTKARLREKVWFPAMDSMTDEMVRRCHACTITGGSPAPAPVITEDPVNTPWTHLSMDFGSFPDGRPMLVIIDSFSKFPIVKTVESTAFPNVKRVLDKVFSLLGLPEEIRSDNGPPFQGREFHAYLENLAIKHRKITPLWPQANGEVERLMRTLNRAIRIAVDNGENAEAAVDHFLGAYRRTPHSTTKFAPASLLFKRAPRDHIPVSPTWRPADRDNGAVQARREVTNQKASEARGAKETTIKVGDRVVIRDRHPGWKFQTPYEPEVWTVEAVKGTMVTVKRGSAAITRNVSHFKRTHQRETDPEDVRSPDVELDEGPIGSPRSEPCHSGDRLRIDQPGSSREDSRHDLGRETGSPSGVTDEPPPRSQKYGLRPNPGPSQWLKDFVCTSP